MHFFYFRFGLLSTRKEEEISGDLLIEHILYERGMF